MSAADRFEERSETTDKDVSTQPVKLTVESRAHGWRLDHYLARLFPNYSRARLQKAIENKMQVGMDFGWLLEQGRDSVKFNFEIVNNNTISLFGSSDSIWSGVINVININTGLLVFEKEIQECTSEMYRFQ